MKIISLLLIVGVCLAAQPFAAAQTQTAYKADLLVFDGKRFNAAPVEIFLESDAVVIRGRKKSFPARSISFTAIESADYTYSDKPRYTVATLSALALGITALPLFASKTKKNWLTITAANNSAILQLQSSNYRMLLLEMRGRGVKLTDSGDRDEKDENQKNKKAKN